MKSASIFVLFTLLVVSLHGQVITGKVIDSSNAEPLVYASIGVVDSPIGTITDENGNFKIDVNGQSPNAIIRISTISYKPKSFTIEELSNKENTIKLIVDTIHLEAVVVRPSGKIKDVGSFNNNTTIRGGWGGTEYAKGYETGLKIQLGTKPVNLKSLHINLYKQSFDTVILRLHIRSISHRMPSEELLSSNILIAVTKSSGLVDIDLSNYNLVFKGDIALSLEWIRVVGVHKDRFFKPTKKFGSEPHPCVLFTQSKQGTTYYRRGCENNWVRQKMSPCIYLTVQE